MFILRLGGVLILFVQVSCIGGNSLVSDLNRQSRGLQLEAIRENQTGEQMVADRNRLASQLVDHGHEASAQAVPDPSPDPPRDGGKSEEPPSISSSACKVGGL